LAQGALLRQYIGAGIPIFYSYLAFLNQIQNKQLAAFFLLMGHRLKIVLYLAEREIH
jgi:hypothetical protein